MARPRSPTDRWLCRAEPSAVDQGSWILLPCLIPTLILSPFTVCECSDRSDHPPAVSEGIVLHLCWLYCGRGKIQCWTSGSDPAPACFPQPWPWMSFLALPEIEQQGEPFIVHLKPWRQSVGSYTFLKCNRHKKPPNHQKDFFTAKRV